MLVTLLVDPQDSRRESRTESLREAGFAVAVAGRPDDIASGLSPDVVVIAGDVDLATRDAVVGRVGPLPMIRDDGDAERLLASLHQLAADARPLVTLGEVTVDLRTKTVLRQGESTSLSDKESALLAWLLSRQGAIATRSELLVHVWGYHPDSTSRTVDVTLGRLREKIETDAKNPACLLTVRGQGYRLVGVELTSVKPGVRSAAPANVIGRDPDLQRIAELLQRGRVLTLLGPPGVGKTTLGRAALANTDGVFVELEHATTEDGVRAAMCAALGLPAHDTSPDRVVAALDALPGHVVVLDNAEQVTEALVSVFDEWVGADVAWLVTSRLRLRLDCEVVVEVEALDSDAAVEVFLARARTRSPSYASSNADLAHVRGLVADLEHMPLAIELAAARTRLFSPRALRERVAKSLSVLRDDRRDRPGRQKTLAAAVAWSWDLLTGAEKRAMMQLSVCVGGVEVADAEAMMDVGEHDHIVVLEALVDHSLAQIDASGRMTQLASVREFARTQLHESGEMDDDVRRHASVFRDRARDWAAGRDGDDAWRVAEEIERDRENLTRALPHMVDAAGVADVLTSLHVSWELSGVAQTDLTQASDVLMRHDGPPRVDGAFYLCLALARSGRVPEADGWLERVSDKATSPAHHMRLLYLRAQVAQRQGDMATAESLYQQVCSVPADDPAVYSRALISRVVRLRATSRLDAALTLANEGLAWASVRGVPTAELSLRVVLASIHRLLRHHDASIAACRATLQVHRARGADEPTAQMLGLIGMNLQESGRADEALTVLDEAIERAGRLGLVRLNGRLMGVRSRAKWCLADFHGAQADAQAAIAVNMSCSDAEGLVANRTAKGTADRELGLMDSALLGLREAERLAQSLGSPRGLAQAAVQRAITALATGDLAEAKDALTVGLSAEHASSDAVLHALCAVVELALGASPYEALAAARASLTVSDPDRSPSGLVAVVAALAAKRRGETPDWSAAERALAPGWEPSFTDALSAVRDGTSAQFQLSTVLAGLT